MKIKPALKATAAILAIFIACFGYWRPLDATVGFAAVVTFGLFALGAVVALWYSIYKLFGGE